MSKIKAEIKGLDKIQIDIKTFIKNSVNSEELLKEIGASAVEQIRNETKLGRGEYDQKTEITDVSIEVRRLLKKKNKTGIAYGDKKNNLTFTGQLLDSISFSVNKATAGIKLFLKDTRKETVPITKDERQVLYDKLLDKDHNVTNRFKNTHDVNSKTGKATKSTASAELKAIFIASLPKEPKTNTEVMKDLYSRGFRFFFISNRVKAQLESKIKAFLRRKLANYKAAKRSLK